MNERTKYIGSLIRQTIENIDPNAQIILYGSRARGEEREHSDEEEFVKILFQI